MSVGFGFSAGDFIAALELVTTVVTALRESGGSSAEYHALIFQLYTLETALLRVKTLELDDSQHAEVVALRQAASQCQRTIDAFWEKIRKYQPSLREGGSGSRVKDTWRKVKWAICKKDDLVKFKADLMGHTESIELLLTTVQMAASRIDGKSAQSNHRSLVGKVQDSYFGCMQRMTVVLERISTGIQQGKQLLEMTAKVIQTNVEIFKVILEIQAVITRVPGQVDRQQPVYLVDAIGRHTPFHLEFITCAESLTAVLKNNFREIGSGSVKIEKGEFAIQDSATHKDIDLALAWQTCFFPGQKVDMSMLFVTNKSITNRCPRCSAETTPNIESQDDIQCARCGIVYRSASIVQLVSPEPDEMIKRLPVWESINRRRLKRKVTFDEEENEIALFKRVRITHKTLMKLPKPNSRPGSPVSVAESDTYPEVTYLLPRSPSRSASPEEMDLDDKDEGGDPPINRKRPSAVAYNMKAVVRSNTWRQTTVLGSVKEHEIPDRWTLVRKNAAERVAARQSEAHARRTDGDDVETSDEDSIESGWDAFDSAWQELGLQLE